MQPDDLIAPSYTDFAAILFEGMSEREAYIAGLKDGTKDKKTGWRRHIRSTGLCFEAYEEGYLDAINAE